MMRLYDLLLRAYPPAFRDRFGEGMRHALASDLARARSRGRVAAAMFWLITIWQAASLGLSARRAERRQRPHKFSPIPTSRGTSMQTFFSIDWRDALRSLRATPVITAAAVLSLALGIGANTALFTIFNSLLLKTLPVREPQQLAVLDDGSWTYPIWEQVKARGTMFDGVFAWSNFGIDLAPSGATDMVAGAFVSGRTFEVLGVSAQLGRTITPDDDVRGGGPGGPVAVISHGLWQKRYAGAGDVVGKPISVNRVKYSIIGVTPPEFFGTEVGRNVEVMIPFGTEPLLRPSALDARSTWWLEIFARLKPGQSLADATSALRGLQPLIRTATLPQDWSDSEKASYLKEPLTIVSAATGRSALRSRFEEPLNVIMAVVGLVLLIACANIASLLVARAVSRRHELSLRLALGASRWRISRQLVAESALMSIAGGAIGLAFAYWGSRMLVRQLTTSATNVVFLDLHFDWRVLGFTALVALMTTTIFGLAPASGTMRIQPNEVLRERGRGVAGDARFGLRNVLVVIQVALSLALVVAAALFGRTLSGLTTRQLGFVPDPVLTISLNAGKTGVPKDQFGPLFDQVVDAVKAVPGVANVGASFTTPVGNAAWNTRLEVPGMPEASSMRPAPWVNTVTPDWFATYGMTIVDGRSIEATDRIGTPKVAVVNQTFATRYFPGRRAVGARFKVDREADDIEIVGVVADAVYRSLRADMAPTIFFAQDQQPAGRDLMLSVRAAGGSPGALTRSIADAIGRVNPLIAMTFRPLSDQIGASLVQERLVATLSGFFGALALMLAGLGLYGVTSHAVSRQRAEIGIRMALGARPAGIVAMVLRRTSWLVGIGVIAGAALSFWGATYLKTLLYGVQPRDLLTFVGAGAVLIAVGLVAAWLPARRAAKVEPTTALRSS